MSFALSCLLFALLPGAAAVLFGYAAGRDPELWRKLPRERNVGIVLGIACLAWSAWYAVPMLEGGLARYQRVIMLLVPVVAVLSYLYLNYVFTRALGGLMMLAATHMLHAAFVAHLPARGVFSAICYLVAVAGMFALATPWRFRDLLKLGAENVRWRAGLAAGNGILAIALLVFAFLGR